MEAPRRRRTGAAHGQLQRVPAPALQNQRKNKHSLMPHLSKMTAAWSSFSICLVSNQQRAKAGPQQKYLEHQAPSLNTGAPPRALCPRLWSKGASESSSFTTIHPPQASKVGKCVWTVPQPFPRVLGHRRESSVSQDMWRGEQERPEVGKAAGQQAAATSRAQLLRHVTMVRRMLRTRAQSCRQLPVARPVPLRLPSVTTNPERGNLPKLPVTRWAFHGISATLPSQGWLVSGLCGEHGSQSCPR